MSLFDQEHKRKYLSTALFRNIRSNLVNRLHINLLSLILLKYCWLWHKSSNEINNTQISTPSTKFVFFRLIGKTRWPPWPLICRDIFYFSSETAERNSTKIDRKQDLNVFYQVHVFRVDRKNKMAALVSDWLRHFWLLWNCWTEFNDTWQKARSQHPLPSLCFSGQWEKQDGRPGRSVKKVALCTPVHVMWPFGPFVTTVITHLSLFLFWAITFTILITAMNQVIQDWSGKTKGKK